MNFEVTNVDIILVAIAVAAIIIILILEFNKSLKARLNVMIGLLFAIMVLLAAITCMLYPQYRNSRDIRNTLQQFDSPDEYGRRTHGSAGQGEQTEPGQ